MVRGGEGLGVRGVLAAPLKRGEPRPDKSGREDDKGSASGG